MFWFKNAAQRRLDFLRSPAGTHHVHKLAKLYLGEPIHVFTSVVKDRVVGPELTEFTNYEGAFELASFLVFRADLLHHQKGWVSEGDIVMPAIFDEFDNIFRRIYPGINVRRLLDNRLEQYGLALRSNGMGRCFLYLEQFIYQAAGQSEPPVWDVSNFTILVVDFLCAGQMKELLQGIEDTVISRLFGAFAGFYEIAESK